jgi:hypothetical protein
VRERDSTCECCTDALGAADFALGKRAENFDAYIGNDLGTSDVCKVFGTWHAKPGEEKG